jgi:glutamyl-tRNA reductase
MSSVCSTEQLDFLVIGLNHHTCPVSVREACNRWAAATPELCNDLKRVAGFREVMLIATCNRFEIVAVYATDTSSEVVMLDGTEDAVERCRSYVCEKAGAEVAEFSFTLIGEEAVRHFFRVTSSLDSLVVGEGQITGQVKTAYADAQLKGTTGKYLHRLAQQALNVGKRVRANTKVAEKAVSVSYIAIKLAEQIFGELSSCNVLVLGSGRMAELAALHLAKRRCGSIVIANRTAAKAAELAQRVGGIGISLQEVPLYLPKADVVIGSLTLDRPIIEVAEVRKVRRTRPLFLIDLGIPRNFPAALSKLDGVYLYNVDDLALIMDENRQFREDAASDATVIIEYGVYQFSKWLERVDREPETLSLRQQIQVICEGELERAMPGIRGEDPLLLESIVDRIANKVSHVTQRVVEAGVNRLRSRATGEFISDGENDLEWNGARNSFR